MNICPTFEKICKKTAVFMPRTGGNGAFPGWETALFPANHGKKKKSNGYDENEAIKMKKTLDKEKPVAYN